MSRIPSWTRHPLRIFGILAGAGLFAYLIWRAGLTDIWQNLSKLGWGFIAVLGLAGVSHLARTWAWRLTLGEDKRKISFPRLLGLRLGAEAAGQLGIVGQTLGDSIRVSLMGTEIPIARGIASVSLDRGLQFVTGTMITIAGILVALPVVSLSYALRLYAGLFVVALIAFLLLAILALRKRWPVLSGSARIVGRVRALKNWTDKRYLLIQSVENTLLDFHHKTPKIFWASFSLNLASHCMAILEVCLLLWLMGVKVDFFGALVIEALTKLVNVIGTINPGNIGTYEGGNMLIGKMFGLSAAAGLALGLSRRLRSFFWAAVGAIWLFLLTRPGKRRDSDSRESTPTTAANDVRTNAYPLNNLPAVGGVAFAIILANGGSSDGQFRAELAQVGTLPILLRTILAAQGLAPSRIVVLVDPIIKQSLRRQLFFTGRLSESVQWIDLTPASLSQQLQFIAAQSGSERLILIHGSTTYHPSLLRQASEWNDERVGLALTTGDRLAGVCALPS